MEETPKKKRGGDTTSAPTGFYTARQATQRLSINQWTFRYYVRNGKIKRYTPPLQRTGYYSKKEIDEMADQITLFNQMNIASEVTETRPALPTDATGIVETLRSYGWQSATPTQRREWYTKNPLIDFVVTSEDRILGYVTAVPYTEEALEAMMSGRKRAWHITPDDILPYEAGKSYDVYIGIAVRQDMSNHTIVAFRLISGFIQFIASLAQQGILIRRMFAVSAEPDGQRLCRAIGFVELPAQPGDMFPRFELDLETSDSLFAQRYREAITQ